MGRARRTITLAVAIGAALLAIAGPAQAATVFSDGFESGGFTAWNGVTTAGDGTAAIQSTIVRTGTVAAQLSESATAGSKAFVRKTFSAAQQDMTASGDFQVVKEGASGGKTRTLETIAPTWYPAHCQQGLGLRTTYSTRESVSLQNSFQSCRCSSKPCW